MENIIFIEEYHKRISQLPTYVALTNRSSYPQPVALQYEVKTMATQVKGVRANKPNDSFGVTNNKNLYRGKYREDVYKDDEEKT